MDFRHLSFSQLFCDFMLHPVCYSEKAFFLIEKRRQYIFEIDSSISKLQARELVEKAFQVNVLKIQSLRLPRKNRRVGQYQGYLPIRKRIIFRLAKNQSIPIL